MPTYNCVPSAKTVPPCPAGTAPNSITVNSTAIAERYPAIFDKMATQDILVAVALVICFVLGITAGKK